MTYNDITRSSNEKKFSLATELSKKWIKSRKENESEREEEEEYAICLRQTYYVSRFSCMEIKVVVKLRNSVATVTSCDILISTVPLINRINYSRRYAEETAANLGVRVRAGDDWRTTTLIGDDPRYRERARA